jgi:anhydro-N-acetylmuramic acid kinase
VTNALETIRKKKTKLCIGLMSGTSLDGIDAALVKITGSGITANLSLIDWKIYPYPGGLQEQIQAHIHRNSIKLSGFSQLNFLLGELYAQAALKILKKNGVTTDRVDLVGCHGQTVWHEPKPQNLYGKQIRSTLQLGEPSVIQVRTGIVTVADFRVKDVALGGEGAPLIPYFDYVMFRSERENRGILNIGGIANFTVVPKNSPLSRVYGFDSGPGNILIDRLMQNYFNTAFDRSGRISRKHSPDRKLLSKMMRHSFIVRKPPKTTGREEFGDAYVEKVMQWGKALKLKPEQVLSTVTEFTAGSIAKNYDLHIRRHHKLDRIIVSGGGVHNPEIMKRLRSSIPGCVIETSDVYGIPPDCKEAVAFAFFANETVAGIPSHIPGVTGAKTSGILGKIIL